MLNPFIGNSKDYVKMERLGEGTYGVVFKGRHIQSEEVVAIKKVKMFPDQLKTEGFPIATIREVSLLRELHHPNIVELKGILLGRKRNIYLVFEYLFTDLMAFSNKTVVPVYNIFFQIVRAVCFCHSHRIIHRDLKLQNILIDHKGIVKLADFGLARPFEIPANEYTNKIGSLWYRSPELLLRTNSYSCAVDVWSLGCIFAELVLKKPLFPGDCELGQLIKIFKAVGTPTDKTWPGILSFKNFSPKFPKFRPSLNQIIRPMKLDTASRNCLSRMLTPDPHSRITSRQILEHECFDILDKTSLPQ